MTPAEIVEEGFKWGMAQHRDEILGLVAWLQARGPLRNVLEIGTLHGGTARIWGYLSEGLVISVDKPEGIHGGADHGYTELKCHDRNTRLFDALFPRFRGVLGESLAERTLDAVDSIIGPGEGLDLLFIDGDHRLPAVSADYEMYRTWVNPGGLIVFHDINDTEVHRNADCRVDVLWNYLKTKHETREFNIHADWGGIGVLHV